MATQLEIPAQPAPLKPWQRRSLNANNSEPGSYNSMSSPIGSPIQNGNGAHSNIGINQNVGGGHSNLGGPGSSSSSSTIANNGGGANTMVGGVGNNLNPNGDLTQLDSNFNATLNTLAGENGLGTFAEIAGGGGIGGAGMGGGVPLGNAQQSIGVDPAAINPNLGGIPTIDNATPLLDNNNTSNAMGSSPLDVENMGSPLDGSGTLDTTGNANAMGTTGYDTTNSMYGNSMYGMNSGMYGGGGLYGGGGMYGGMGGMGGMGNSMGMDPNNPQNNQNLFFGSTAESLFRLHELLSLNGKFLDWIADHSEWILKKLRYCLESISRLLKSMGAPAIQDGKSSGSSSRYAAANSSRLSSSSSPISANDNSQVSQLESYNLHHKRKRLFRLFCLVGAFAAFVYYRVRDARRMIVDRRMSRQNEMVDMARHVYRYRSARL